MNEEGEALRDELTEQIAWQQELHDKNDAPVRYGHGRLDAQGHILNKVALTTRVPPMKTVLADAPASYPFVWNTSQQTKIQWNGIATNKARISSFGLDTDIGALIRNTSRSYWRLRPCRDQQAQSLARLLSSARVIALIELERKLASCSRRNGRQICSAPLDAAKVAAGKDLFIRNAASATTISNPEDTTR